MILLSDDEEEEKTKEEEEEEWSGIVGVKEEAEEKEG